MKIPLSIRRDYDEQLDKIIRLQKFVDDSIRAAKKPNWHYESRIKSKESFALKIETGRFPDPKELEDFFACMLVVENSKSLVEAEDMIKSKFDFIERRPSSDKKTQKKAECFIFDDLRLYVRWKDDPVLPPTGINGALFEIQIKTFLQHAWSIATHDLIYKSDTVDWAKERVAFQIKAMLEHAEMSIQEVEKISKSNLVNKIDKKTGKIIKILKLLNEYWKRQDLPNDLVRLAANVLYLLESFNITISKLNSVLQIETNENRGAKILNLSPYGCILQSILNQESEKVKKTIENKTSKHSIFFPEEVELPGDFPDIRS